VTVLPLRQESEIFIQHIQYVRNWYQLRCDRAQCVGSIGFTGNLCIQFKEEALNLMCITFWLVDTCWGVVFPSVLCDSGCGNIGVHKSWLAGYYGDHTLCSGT
jgi:hypothetical protein